MQFTFKRDEEGRERIYVGDVCVASSEATEMFRRSGAERDFWIIAHVHGASNEVLHDAIGRADESGFWECETCRHHGVYGDCRRRHNEVTVEVPVADNAVLSVTVGGDES